MVHSYNITTFDLAFTEVDENFKSKGFKSSSKETLFKLAEIYRAGRINFVGKEVHSKIRNALEIMVGLIDDGATRDELFEHLQEEYGYSLEHLGGIRFH